MEKSTPQCYCITNIVLECDLEETDHPAPTSTMNVRIFSPDRKTDEFLVLEKVSESRLVWKYHGSVKLMDDTTFHVTWDDTGDFGVVNLTKAELKEFSTSTSTGSDKGVRREIVIETDELVLKMRFDICMTSEERVPPHEDLSLLYHRRGGGYHY